MINHVLQTILAPQTRVQPGRQREQLLGVVVIGFEGFMEAKIDSCTIASCSRACRTRSFLCLFCRPRLLICVSHNVGQKRKRKKSVRQQAAGYGLGGPATGSGRLKTITLHPQLRDAASDLKAVDARACLGSSRFRAWVRSGERMVVPGIAKGCSAASAPCIGTIVLADHFSHCKTRCFCTAGNECIVQTLTRFASRGRWMQLCPLIKHRVDLFRTAFPRLGFK